jgi:hypothetical protein
MCELDLNEEESEARLQLAVNPTCKN